MTKPQDFFGPAVPKTVLNKPFFHAQDQKAYNVDGGTSIADAWTKRTLNTVIYNDIQGASLASDAVSLPAGVYYVEASNCQAAGAAAIARYSAVFKDGVKALQGVQEYSNTGSGVIQNSPVVSGIITLSTPGTIDLRYYVGISLSTGGLGYSNNFGSITDASIPSIYADLKIWQLDRSLEVAPKAVNSGLQTVPGLDTTGNVMGFDISKTGTNQLTVSKGSCLDSTLEVPMALTADTVVSIPSVANSIYHIFIVRLVSDGTFTVNVYATEAAVASDNTVDKWRWLGFWRTNATGGCVVGLQVGELLMFGRRSEQYLWNLNGVTVYTQKDHSTFIPINRVREILYGIVDSGGTNGHCMTSIDGINSESYIGQGLTSSDNDISSWSNPSFKSETFLPFTNNRYFRMQSDNGGIYLHAVKVRR